MSTEMAAYYVSVVPTLKGAAGTIRAEIEDIVGQPFRDAPKQMIPGMAQAVQSIGQQTQAVGAQISSIGSSLSKAITLPVIGAGVAVGGLVAALGWGRLKSIDSAQGQLRGLGYATEDVDRITQNLVGALEGGMLTMGQATSAAAGGLAAGVKEGAELTRYIQLLDAATAGSNGTFEEMNMIFARIQGAGKMMTGELSMIEQRMPGFSAAVAEHMGVSQGELAALVTAGEVTSEDFLDVMDAFGGQMAVEYAKTWEGMLQNTWAYVGILGEALLGGVFQQSKESIAELIEFLASDEVAAWAAETGVIIGTFFAQAITSIRSAISWWMQLDSSTQGLILSIAGIVVAAGPVLIVLGKVIGVIGGVIAAVGRVMGWFTKMTVAQNGTRTAVGRFLTTLGRFAGPIGLAISALVLLWQHSETFRNGIRDLALHVWEALQQIGAEFMRLWTDAVQPALSQMQPLATAAFGFFQTWVLPLIETVFTLIFAVIKMVIDNIVGLFTGLVDVISGVINLIVALFTGDWAGAWEALKQIVSGAVQAVWNLVQLWFIGRLLTIIRSFGQTLLRGVWRPLWNGIQSFLRGILNGIRTFVTSVFNGIRSFFSGNLNAVRNLFSTIWRAVQTTVRTGAMSIQTLIRVIFSAIRTYFSTVLNAYRTLFSTIWNAIRSLVMGAVNAIRSVVVGGFNAIRSIVTSVMNTVRSIVSLVWNGIRSGSSSAMSFMRSAVTNGFRAVMTAVRNLPTTIRNVFSNAGSLLVNAGRNIIQGLTKGIKKAIGGAVDAVKGGVQRIRNLLPFSPAKDGPLSGKGYTLYSGQALMGDFGKGMENASGGAVAAARGVTEEVAEAMAAQVSIPDYLPSSWTAGSLPSVAHVPSKAYEPATAGAGANGSGEGAPEYHFHDIAADTAYELMQEAEFAHKKHLAKARHS